MNKKEKGEADNMTTTTQKERTENPFNDIFSFWKNNPIAFKTLPWKFPSMEKQRDAFLDVCKLDQSHCMKLYSLGMDFMMKMSEAGRAGNGADIFKAGNESWREATTVTDKYLRDRSTALTKFCQSFTPAREG